MGKSIKFYRLSSIDFASDSSKIYEAGELYFIYNLPADGTGQLLLCTATGGLGIATFECYTVEGGGGITYSAGTNIDITGGVISTKNVLNTTQTDEHINTALTASLHGHEVNKDVPADAVFTDTVYDDTALSGRVTGIDDRVTAIENKEVDWDNKQNLLISGSNIKTVNNNSLLGSGDITVGDAFDAAVVHNTGNENISGQKTFTGTGSTVINGGSVSTDGLTAGDISIATPERISFNDGDSLADKLDAKQDDLVFSASGSNLTSITNTETGTTYNIPQGTVTSIGITAGTGIDISNSPITTSGNISIGLATTVAGSTTISSISSIPVTHRAVLANISVNGVLSFTSLPADGFEVHVIIHNTGSSTISVTLPSSGSYICTSESTIYIAAGKYGEANVVVIGSTGYVHGINSI